MMRKVLALILTLGFVAGLTVVAEAGVKIGGSLRNELTYSWFNDDFEGNGDLFRLDIFNISTSRLKFTYLSEDKRFKGYAEINLSSRTDGLNVYTRRAYFSYRWDGGSILFGQYGDMANSYANNQVLDGDRSLIGYGWAYWNRIEQIRLTLGQKYKFKAAVSAPRKDQTLIFQTGEGIGSNQAVYHYLPAFEAALDISLGNINVYPWIRYELTHIDYTHPAEFDRRTIHFHSLDVGLQIKGDFGLVGFTAGFHYGINTSMGFPSGVGFFWDSPGYPILSYETGNMADHRQVSTFGELRIGQLSLGAGFQRGSRKELDGVELWDQAAFTWAVYANYKIPFGKINFIPEVFYIDGGEGQNGDNLGSVFKAGLFVSLDF